MNIPSTHCTKKSINTSPHNVSKHHFVLPQNDIIYDIKCLELYTAILPSALCFFFFRHAICLQNSSRPLTPPSHQAAFRHRIILEDLNHTGPLAPNVADEFMEASASPFLFTEMSPQTIASASLGQVGFRAWGWVRRQRALGFAWACHRGGWLFLVVEARGNAEVCCFLFFLFEVGVV